MPAVTGGVDEKKTQNTGWLCTGGCSCRNLLRCLRGNLRRRSGCRAGGASGISRVAAAAGINQEKTQDGWVSGLGAVSGVNTARVASDDGSPHH